MISTLSIVKWKISVKMSDYFTRNPYEIEHHHSVLSLNGLITETTGKLPNTEELLLSQWSEKNSLGYLNLMDYREKIKSSEWVPWVEYPCKEEQILNYTQTIVFGFYRFSILDKIELEDNTILLSQLIQKMLTVCNLYSNILTADRRIKLYVEVIERLSSKLFCVPTSFLNLWNVLCGNSTETKICVLSHLLTTSNDTNMLHYILRIAQAAQFNFWGMWFKKSEEDYLCFCPVTTALLEGNAKQLVVLVKYGFEQNHGRLAVYDSYYYYAGGIYPWFKAPLEERDPSRRAVVTEVLLFLFWVNREKKQPMRRSLIKCFRHVWNVNAVPFVTESELLTVVRHRFLHPCRTGSRWFPQTFDQFVDLIEHYYQFLWPEESTEVIQPRSLEQLCKCSIRKILTRSYNMPHGITKLGIPKKLQDLLVM